MAGRNAGAPGGAAGAAVSLSLPELQPTPVAAVLPAPAEGKRRIGTLLVRGVRGE